MNFATFLEPPTHKFNSKSHPPPQYYRSIPRQNKTIKSIPTKDNDLRKPIDEFTPVRRTSRSRAILVFPHEHSRRVTACESIPKASQDTHTHIQRRLWWFFAGCRRFGCVVWEQTAPPGQSARWKFIVKGALNLKQLGLHTEFQAQLTLNRFSEDSCGWVGVFDLLGVVGRRKISIRCGLLRE